MPVDEPQAAATGQCREDPEQERAIAAEDERPLTALENPTHTGGDRRRGAAHLARCDDARGRLAVAATDVGVGLARIARAQALEQSGGAKRGRPSFLAAPRPRGVDGRVDHGEGRHVRGFCAIWRLPAPRGRRRRYVASRTRSMIRVSARETNRATYRISLRRMEPGIATLPHFARSGSGLVDARLVRGVSYRLAFEGLINKLASVFVHFAGDPGKLPCLEGLESFLDFFIELGGSLVLAPSTRYLVDDVRGVAERGDIGESFLGGELRPRIRARYSASCGLLTGPTFSATLANTAPQSGSWRITPMAPSAWPRSLALFPPSTKSR